MTKRGSGESSGEKETRAVWLGLCQGRLGFSVWASGFRSLGQQGLELRIARV